MFRLFVLSLTLAGLPAWVHAQSIDFVQKNKDLGGAPRGALLTHHFEFTNNTGQTVQVMGTRTSCTKCSSVSASKTVINPGDKGSIVVNIYTANFLGHKPFTIYAMFDKPYVQEIMLSIQATSREDIMLNPDRINFGRVTFGSEPTQSVNLEFRGSTVVKVEGIENDNAYIIPKVESMGTVNGAQVHKISATLRKDLPAGSWHAMIGIRTNDPSTPIIRIPLVVEMEGLLTISPSMIDANQSNNLKKMVVVRGIKDFKILKVEGTTDEVKIEKISDEAKKAHMVSVNITPKDGKLSSNVKLKFITDLQDSVIELPIQGAMISAR